MKEVRNILIGLEILEETTQLCYYDRKGMEMVSIPLKVGTNIYRFPTKLLKMQDRDVWHYGIEAEYFAKIGKGILVENPLTLAYKNERTRIHGEPMEAWEILERYLQEVLKLFGLPNITESAGGIAITVEKLNAPLVRNMKKALTSLGFSEDSIVMEDQKESFYYYCYSQKPAVWAGSLALIQFRDNRVSFRRMTELNEGGIRQNSLRLINEIMLPEDAREKDRRFSDFILNCTEDQDYSAIYITGDGFSRDWADQSIQTLIEQSRYVFEGEELFVKGVCYSLLEQKEKHQFRNRLYLGEDKVLTALTMDVLTGDKTQTIYLVESGKNWYDNGIEVELIPDGRADLALTLLSVDEKLHRRIHVDYPELPKRPNRATRLKLTAECTSPEVCSLTVRDLGFGDLYPATGNSLTHEISLDLTIDPEAFTEERR